MCVMNSKAKTRVRSKESRNDNNVIKIKRRQIQTVEFTDPTISQITTYHKDEHERQGRKRTLHPVWPEELWSVLHMIIQLYEVMLFRYTVLRDSCNLLFLLGVTTSDVV